MKTERDGKLWIALERLLWRYPLLGGLAASWDCRPVGTDTMAVGMDDQTFVLYYSPEFVAETEIDQLVGVLHHEARHVIYGHVMMDPDEFADEEALLIAQEVTVNEGLPEPLPEGAVRLIDFPELPPDEDTVTRYDRLCRKFGTDLQSELDQTQQDKTRKPQERDPESTLQNESDSQRGKGGETPCSESANALRNAGGEKLLCESDKISQSEEANTSQGRGCENAGGESNNPSQDKGGGPQCDKGGKTPGNESANASQGEDESGSTSQGEGGVPISRKGREAVHGHWQEIRDHGSHAKNLIDLAVQAFLIESEDRQSTDAVETTALDCVCRTWRIVPGKELTQLPYVQGEPHVNWRRALRRRAGRLLSRRPTYSRPPRRFPDMIGIVPGTAQSATKPTILSVIDTSASMTDEMLGAINRELESLSRDHQVVVVECDCEIQAVYRYRPIICVQGRGGTDFRPPLERAFLRKHAPDLVIFFTDGLGPAPDHRPYLPVIWTLTPGGTPPVPWGEVLRMA